LKQTRSSADDKLFSGLRVNIYAVFYSLNFAYFRHVLLLYIDSSSTEDLDLFLYQQAAKFNWSSQFISPW